MAVLSFSRLNLGARVTMFSWRLSLIFPLLVSLTFRSKFSAKPMPRFMPTV